MDTKTAETNFYTHTTMKNTKPVAAKADRKPRRADVDSHDQDALFFSSTSISSDSSFGFSSSDTESLSRASCFAPRPRPKPRPASASSSFRSNRHAAFDAFCPNSPTWEKQHQQQQHEEALIIKSKSRAFMIYNNLKKVKQPISPGGRVASFLNSLFANAKKNTPRTCRGAASSSSSSSSSSSYYSATCPSSSRSCLSKTLTSERDALRDGVKRTVRFYPVSVIVGEDSRPCGHKRLGEEKEPSRDFSRHNHKKKSDLLFQNLSLRTNVDDDDEDDDDASSYASSDLFELDHLALFGSGRYCEELPVYETTHVGTNRAIANGLIV
ncbi:hypothetical protein Fmac_031829 [Flemingia macrophylla]|uniref:Protein BIG GRAIN 1-like B n=1 Tax=Flemingia macrophylla TaxID=520843 RepID=A0ABD1L356_9FABA